MILVLAAALGLAAFEARADTEWWSEAFRRASAPPAQDSSKAEPRRAKARASVADAAARKRSDKEAENGAKPPSPFVGQHFSTPAKGLWEWRILRPAWTAADEAEFEAFVTSIGESTCATVHECIADPTVNPRYHHQHPADMRFVADCADLPYLLRGYFAWMNGLPFSHSAAVAQRVSSNGLRIPGNQVVGRMDIVGPGPDPRQALARIAQLVSSEHFRMPPGALDAFLPDHYPVRLTRESIRPGTMIFDPDGHVAIVYKVTADGRIHYIDAHPDNTLTRGIYGREFTRAAPEMGAGFKRWRPQELKGATMGTDGQLVGGTIELASDSAIADWSDEQFFGTNERQFYYRSRIRQVAWSRATFAIAGETLDYYDFLRVRLAGTDFKYDPIDETRSMVGALCQDIGYRVAAVDSAVRAGIHLRPQPPRLPGNIYATDGDWEVYATPSRDARLKTAFEELRDEVERFLALHRAGSRRLAYDGDDLRRDLADVYRRETRACRIAYARTDGVTQPLEFDEVRRRLFRLSFDPHHCVERRWGADDAAELRSCPDGAEKRAWYDAQDRLRNQITRTYGEKMGWTLAELQRRDLDIGMKEAPDVDVLKLLEGVTGSAVAARQPRPARGR